MEWLKNQGCQWNKYSPLSAIKKGHLHALQWLVENGCPWDENDCFQMSIIFGHLEILEWIRNTKEFYHFVWESLINAACNGRDKVFKYLLQVCTEAELKCFYKLTGGGLYDSNSNGNQFLKSLAAAKGHSEIVTLLGSHFAGPSYFTRPLTPLNFKGLREDDEEGRIRTFRIWVLKVVRQNSVLDPIRYEKAAKKGSVETLRWLQNKKIPISDLKKTELAMIAIKRGNLDVLKWLRRQNIVFLPNTCEKAVMCRRLDVLQWLVENGSCQWNAKACLQQALEVMGGETQSDNDNNSFHLSNGKHMERDSILEMIEWITEKGGLKREKENDIDMMKAT